MVVLRNFKARNGQMQLYLFALISSNIFKMPKKLMKPEVHMYG